MQLQYSSHDNQCLFGTLCLLWFSPHGARSRHQDQRMFHSCFQIQAHSLESAVRATFSEEWWMLANCIFLFSILLITSASSQLGLSSLIFHRPCSGLCDGHSFRMWALLQVPWEFPLFIYLLFAGRPSVLLTSFVTLWHFWGISQGRTFHCGASLLRQNWWTTLYIYVWAVARQEVRAASSYLDRKYLDISWIAPPNIPIEPTESIASSSSSSSWQLPVRIVWQLCYSV